MNSLEKSMFKIKRFLSSYSVFQDLIYKSNQN